MTVALVVLLLVVAYGNTEASHWPLGIHPVDTILAGLASWSNKFGNLTVTIYSLANVIVILSLYVVYFYGGCWLRIGGWCGGKVSVAVFLLRCERHLGQTMMTVLLLPI
jgi:hypothetical protein